MSTPLRSHIRCWARMKDTEGKGVDVLVALSPRSIVQEYEELLEQLDLHAGSSFLPRLRQ